MKNNKINMFLIITTMLSSIILLIGATFSYFTTRSMSKTNAVSMEAGKVKLGLGVSSISTGHKLIPTNDSDIMTAYNQNCIDDNGNGACLSYGLEIFNYNKSQDIIGTIDFEVTDIDNLSYMLLDENNNIYLDKVSVEDGINNNLPLGNPFSLQDGSELIPASKKFTLLIWLSNLDEDQSEFDAGGSFKASITYNSVYGGKLTASIDGYEDNSNNTSHLGGV